MLKIEHEPSKQQSLLCCRGCLATDCRLYNIHEHEVDDAFSHITDIPVSRALPQHLCTWCLTLLRKCASFRAMCVRSQQRLTEILEWRMDITCIQGPPLRPFDMSRTDVITIDCVPSETNIMYEPEHMTEDNVKAEPGIKTKTEYTNENDNSFGSSNDMNVDSKTQTVIKVEKTLLECNDQNNDQDDDLLKISNVKTETDDVLINDVMEPDSEIEFDHEEDVMETNDEEDLSSVDNHANPETQKKSSKNMKLKTKKINDEEDLSSVDNHANPETQKKSSKNTKLKTKQINDEEDLSSVDNHANPETQKKSSKNMKLKTERNKKKVVKEGNTSYDNTNIMYEWKDNVCMRRVNPIKGQRRTKVRLKDLRHPTEGYILFDFPSYERDNNLKVVLLSKEEQLEEILSRKKSRKYLESPFKCEECGKTFAKQTPYNNHRALMHNPSMEHPCEICGARFRRQCLRQSHQDTHRFKFFCNECNFVSRVRCQAQTHHAMHAGKTYDCKHCGKSFKKSTSYFSHLRLTHPGNSVVCGECGETFVSGQGLRAHMQKTHLVHLKTLKLQKFECSACSVKFASVEALNRHTDKAGEHADLRPCEQCGENCASEAELQEHVREKHPTESHHCERCDTTFSCAAAFATHVRRKHLDQRPRNFSFGSCVCDQCGFIAKNSTLLEYHMRSHLAVKPFACPHCPKTFEIRFKLTWHMRTHTGENLFQCADCPLAFSYKHNLVRHQKVVHLNLYDCFPCDSCERTFTTKSMLKLHIRTIHEGQPWPKRIRKAKGTAPAEDNK